MQRSNIAQSIASTLIAGMIADSLKAPKTLTFKSVAK